ncbi:hypothetical protein AB0F43_30290 [Kribbella sp. NPDC023972]|uniref:hypothetical protein n=1 Tax=Kribbella sp. NPDC023972 TaxID=3154795 RepID=UPI0033E267BC
MDSETWATALVALVGVGASTVVAILTMRRQARLHREQLAAAQATFDREQHVTEQRIEDAVEREHFARLWEVRKDSYSRLAAWLVELREQVDTFTRIGSWTPPSKLEPLTLGQIVLYGHWDVFTRAEVMRGGFYEMLHTAEVFADRLPEGFMSERLNEYSSQAYSLLLKVREEAITLPDWDEPIPLRKQNPEPPTFTIDMSPAPDSGGSPGA